MNGCINKHADRVMCSSYAASSSSSYKMGAQYDKRTISHTYIIVESVGGRINANQTHFPDWYTNRKKGHIYIKILVKCVGTYYGDFHCWSLNVHEGIK